MIIDELSDIIGFDSSYFIESFRARKRFFRINTLKVDVDRFMKDKTFECKQKQIPFICEYSNIKIGNTWEYALGLIHPQSYSSAIIPLLLDVSKNDFILDLTAAPGSKTTEMSMLMENRGVVIANDKKERLPSIFHNIVRLSALNVGITSFDAKRLPDKFKGKFTRVLLDAPCSALGSHEYAWERTNWGIVNTLSRVQKKMILSAFDALKVGGYLLYSTCTITLEENESVILHLLNSRNAELVDIRLDLPHDKAIDLPGAIRIMPWHLNSEAFFAALIKKVD